MIIIVPVILKFHRRVSVFVAPNIITIFKCRYASNTFLRSISKIKTDFLIWLPNTKGGVLSSYPIRLKVDFAELKCYGRCSR